MSPRTAIALKARDHGRRRRAAGLTAAIACAEGGARCACWRRTRALGGRARSADGPYKANLGPHALYSDGALVEVAARARPVCRPTSVRRSAARGCAGRARCAHARRWARPAVGAAPARPRGAGRARTSAAGSPRHTDDRTAEMLSAAAGVYTFYHDPGRALRGVRVGAYRAAVPSPPPPVVRYASRRLEHADRTAGASRARAGRRGRDRHRVWTLCPSRP